MKNNERSGQLALPFGVMSVAILSVVLLTVGFMSPIRTNFFSLINESNQTHLSSLEPIQNRETNEENQSDFLTDNFDQIASPQSMNSLCEMAREPKKFRLMLLNPDNLIPIPNQGGIADGGVCWWHSRLQRSSIYLAHYSPHKLKPNEKETNQILKKLRQMESFVEIPGYSQFSSFIQDNKETVQKFLENWQITDGVFGFGFLMGLPNKSKDFTDSDLQQEIKNLRQQVNQENKIVYQMVQTAGVKSHSWLITDVQISDYDSSAEISVVDPAFPQEISVVRHIGGDNQLSTQMYGQLHSFTQQEKELEKIKQVYLKNCGLKIWD